MLDAAEDQGDRVREAGLLQRLAMGRVAVDGRDPLRRRARRTVSRFSSMIDRLELVLAEQPGERPPDRAVADDDGPVRGRSRLGRRARPSRPCRGRWPGGRPVLDEPPRSRLERADQPVEERVERDRDDGRGDEGVRGRGRRGCRGASPAAARMNENSPICASATATERADAERVAEQQHDRRGRPAACRAGRRPASPRRGRATRAGAAGRTACRPRRRTARRRRRASAAPRSPPGG